MGPTILNRTAYNLYLLSFGLPAVVLLIAGENLPGALGPWAGDHPLSFLSLVGGAFVLLAILPLAVLLLAITLLGRTAQRAFERIGAGDAEGGKALLRRIERWTPRLRWILLHPDQVEAFRGLTSGDDGGGMDAAPAPRFRVIGTDDAGNRIEAAVCATREEADRRREEFERIAEGRAVAYHVEGPSDGRTGGPSAP
jgi:hypothetical protein